MVGKLRNRGPYTKGSSVASSGSLPMPMDNAYRMLSISE